MMNKFLIPLLFIPAFLKADTVFHIKWRTDQLNVEVKTARAPEIVRDRVAEKGIVTPKVSLPIIDTMPEGKIKLADKEPAFLYALVKNTGKRALRFSVAPHSTNPGSSALGFKFNCLCNGHIYEVQPGQIWYKIMLLNTTDLPKAQAITLEHIIFDVEKRPQKLQVHHHHH